MAPGSAKHQQQTPASLLPPQPLLFFAGKGGAGKTTAAASTAIELLRELKPDQRILLFSTDPAHSLSDVLGAHVGDKITSVVRRRGAEMFAYEMNAESAAGRFKREYGETLAEIFERGTFLDKEDIHGLMGLPLPGIDEVMCLLELSDLIAGGEYSRIVVDTAPTGHTLRLLQLPRVFQDWMDALDSLSAKHRYMALHLTRTLPVDDVERFLRDFDARARLVSRLLTDREESAIVVVTIPEPVVFEETERYIEALRKNHNFVSHLVINRVEDAGNGCRYCRARATAQRPILKKLHERLRDLDQIEVGVVPFLNKGLAGLRLFGSLLWEPRGAKSPPSGKAPHERAVDEGPLKSAAAGKQFDLQGKRWLIFGGKGGVGKTTASCAAALALADHDPGRRIMVVSTDPAHSLSDSFREPIGAIKKQVAGLPNLDAMEIDAAARFARIRERYNEFLDEAFGRQNPESTWTIEFDPEAMRGFLAAAPPGIDEILALTAIGDLLAAGDYDTVIVDSAPTGHLLRLLALPSVARSWIAALMKLLLKYKDIVHWNSFVEELLSLSKSLKSTVSLMVDPDATEFICVAAPEALALDESERLAASLSALKVPMRRLLINNVVPDWPAAMCLICASRLRQQKVCIRKFRQAFSKHTDLYSAPQQARPIQGPALLRAHFANWRLVV